MTTYKNIMGNEFTLEQIQEQFNQFAKKFLDENLFFDEIALVTVNDVFIVLASNLHLDVKILSNSTKKSCNYSSDFIFQYLDNEVITRDEAQYL